MNFAYFCIWVLARISLSAIALQTPYSSLASTWTTKQLKGEMLDLARKTNRGLTETSSERDRMLELFSLLEKQAPHRDTFSSPYMNAVWKLEYATADRALGRKGLKTAGDTLQKLDVTNRKLVNSDAVEFFGFKIPRTFAADLEPVSPTSVTFPFCNVVDFRQQ
jgi:hypothetical protein